MNQQLFGNNAVCVYKRAMDSGLIYLNLIYRNAK